MICRCSAATLRAIGVARLHFHHVHGLPQSILQLPGESGIPYDCTLHDYYAICPQYHLADENGRYCGEPDEAGCAACLAGRRAQWGLDIGAWRQALGALLRRAERVIAPSQDVAARIGRYLPGLVDRRLAASRAPRAGARGRRARGDARQSVARKGPAMSSLDARRTRSARGLPLTFRVLGSTTDPIPQSPDAALTIHGSYDEEALAQIARRRACRRALLSRAGARDVFLYAVARARHANPDRRVGARCVHRAACGPCADAAGAWDATAEQWNAALLEAARAAVRGLAGGGCRPDTRNVMMDPDRYVALYLAPLPSHKRAATERVAIPALESRHFHATPAQHELPLTLSELYVAGALCGHAEARAELGRRVEVADREHAELGELRHHRQGDPGRVAVDLVEAQRELKTLRTSARALEDDVAAARKRARELETSTSWRMTAPLRVAVHRLKLGSVEFATHWRATRQLAAPCRTGARPCCAPRVLQRLRVVSCGNCAAAIASRPAAARVYRLEREVRPLGRVPVRCAGGVDRHSRVRRAAVDVHVPRQHRRADGGRLSR